MFVRFLILSGNTGGGHNSAAGAVSDCFTAHGDECDIKDALAFLPHGTSYIVSNGHVFIYKKAPRLFGFFYRLAENHPAKENSDSIIYDMLTVGARSLKKFLEANPYDAVICTHVFAGMIATEAKRKYGIPKRIYFVSTDYTCSPGVAEINADLFFIPHRLLAPEFEEKRIPKDRIVSSGIPVRQSFYEHYEKDTAKKLLDLPKDKRIVLLMCGSMGCGPIKELGSLLCHELPTDAHLVVICGSNKRLYKELKKDLKANNATIVGFTDQMSLYMDAASLALTKPGGLSTSEALAKALPLVLINAVPGCETRNLDFLTVNNFSQTAGSVERLSMLVCKTLQSPETLESISLRLKSQFNTNAAEVIRESVLNNIEKNEEEKQKAVCN